jgi:hypothetical protein
MRHRTHRGPRGRCGHGDPWALPVDRQEWLARLEEHQRDLEQRIADVADLIRHLRDDEPGAAGPATA